MNRKEYKILCEDWRRLLNEEYEKFSAIDNLERINSTNGNKCKLLVYEEGDTVFVAYDRKFSRVKARYGTHGYDKSNAIYGQTFAAPYHVKHNLKKEAGIGEGEKNPAYEICLTTKTLSGHGLGSLMYEVLIEYISSRKDAAVKPDARSVSADAKRVWEKFDARSDIKKVQLDLNDSEYKHLKLRYPTANIEKVTPYNREDDVLMHSAIDDMDADWSESSLSRAYKKDNTELMDELIKRDLLVLVNYEKDNIFISAIKRIFGR